MMYNQEKEKKRLKKILIVKYREDGKLPTIQWCANYMKLPIYRVSELYKELSKEQYLQKNNTRYIPNKIPKEIDQIAELEIQDTKTAKSKNNNHQNFPKKQNKDWPIIVIRILMCIIGIGTAVASIYFTYHKFIEFLIPFWAFTLSFTMVCFMVGSFEAMVIFVGNKQFFLLIPFIAVWLITVSFSMTSTVNVLYNRGIMNVEKDIEINQENIQQNNLIEHYNRIHMELLENKKALLKNLETFQEQLKSEDNEAAESKYLYYIRKEKASIKELEKQIQDNQAKIEEIMTADIYIPDDELQLKKMDFPKWVSSIIKIKTSTVIFLMNTFPAVFIDIMSPLALSLALFLRRKKYVK